MTATITQKHKVEISNSSGKVMITIHNKQNFGMHWLADSPPSELEVGRLIDIHRRTYAGHMRIN